MPLTAENRGTEANGSLSADYCTYCYKDGAFTQDFNMHQMIEFCTQFTDQVNASAGWNLTPEQYKEQMLQYFPSLKRWRNPDLRPLPERAAQLLGQCQEVVLATVSKQGYPRPVPMAKVHAPSFHCIYMATAANSVKVADIQADPRAGLCFFHLGDSVALRGRVEVLTDAQSRRELWQDWFRQHFPGGPEDPTYVLLRFEACEATYYINGEFAHQEL